MWKKNAKYWGRICLEGIGICMGISLVMLLFVAAGNFRYAGGGLAGGLRAACSLYPYYLMLAGMLYLVVGTASYFRSYLPVLISMNATRSRAVLVLILHDAVIILGLTAVSAFIWLSPPGNEAKAMGVLPALSGVLLVMSAVGLIMGAVSARWGRIGTILTMVVCAAAGGTCGAGMASFGKEKAADILKIAADSGALLLLALGAIAYILAGAFAMIVNRKIEVQV